MGAEKTGMKSGVGGERCGQSGAGGGSVPGDVRMINVKLSERWRGETTAMGEESWPGAEKRI